MMLSRSQTLLLSVVLLLATFGSALNHRGFSSLRSLQGDGETPSPPVTGQDLCSSFPLQVGDLWWIQPEKAGFVGGFNDLFDNLSDEDKQSLGFDTQGVLPIAEISTQVERALEDENLDQETRDRYEALMNLFVDGSQGQIVCNVYNSPSGYSARWWYPYNLTKGWRYEVWGDCQDNVWSSFGADQNVEMEAFYNLSEGNGYVQMTNLQPTELENTDEDEVVTTVPWLVVQAKVSFLETLSEDIVNSCCFPSSEDERDCSGVKDAINNASGGGTGTTQAPTGTTEPQTGTTTTPPPLVTTTTGTGFETTTTADQNVTTTTTTSGSNETTTTPGTTASPDTTTEPFTFTFTFTEAGN